MAIILEAPSTATIRYIEMRKSALSAATALIIADGPLRRIRDRVQEFAGAVRDFERAVKKMAWRLPSFQNWHEPPPYIPPFAPLFGGRSECAPLARSKLKRWKSLKEKRAAWGIS